MNVGYDARKGDSGPPEPSQRLSERAIQTILTPRVTVGATPSVCKTEDGTYYVSMTFTTAEVDPRGNEVPGTRAYGVFLLDADEARRLERNLGVLNNGSDLRQERLKRMAEREKHVHAARRRGFEGLVNKTDGESEP